MLHPKPQEPLPASGSAAEERLRAAEEHEGNIPPRTAVPPDGQETLLDVRRHVGAKQIRGAIRYDPAALRAARELVLPIDHENAIALHADSNDDARAIESRLRAAGCGNVRVICESIDEWEEGGGAVEAATREQPVPPG